jgi:hypothetical protein
VNDTRLDEEWQVIASVLPEGWRERAWACGAMRRSRKVGDPEVLMRLILLHVAGGLSLRQATVRAQEQGLATLSDVALLKRLRGAGDWLRELSLGLTKHSCSALHWPVLPAGYRLRAIDATDVQEPGATGTDWRVHYSLELPSLCCDHFELTDRHGGESIERFAIRAGDLVLADRGYCRSRSLAHIQSAQGDYVVRLHSTALRLLNSSGRRFGLLAAVRSLRGLRPGQWELSFPHEAKSYWARLCAVRRSALSTQAERAHVLESARKSRQQASPRFKTLPANRCSIFTGCAGKWS